MHHLHDNQIEELKKKHELDKRVKEASKHPESVEDNLNPRIREILKQIYKDLKEKEGH